MGSKSADLDVTVDIIIPAIIVVGLFLINGIILYFIYRKRKTIVYEEFNEAREQPTTSQPLQSSAAKIEAGRLKSGGGTMSENEDDANGIEMEKL